VARKKKRARAGSKRAGPAIQNRPAPPRREAPWRRFWPVGLLGAGLLVLVVVLLGRANPGPAPSQASPALLASAAGQATGQPVDGIDCQQAEQVLFHIHAHLAVYVGGQPRTIPYGIGIVPPWTVANSQEGPFVASGRCFYSLHAHTQDGVIHVESPVERTYTLGNYFDIWRQSLGPGQVGPAKGTVTAYLNGVPYTGDLRAIPLTAHALIQLDVGTVVSPKPFTFPAGL
jgi:hypothetical protein